MFNLAISTQCTPRHLSSDNDPLFQHHRWQVNLRILDIQEIKSAPHAPLSPPFIERLIGTIRREYLNQVLFWNACDLERRLDAFRRYYNAHRIHTALDGATPSEMSGETTSRRADYSQFVRGGVGVASAGQPA
jgi:transposase InsO family protein